MKISVLDQTHLVEGMSAEEGFAQTVELAQYVDQLGYHRFWMSEHHNSDALAGSSPEILASYLLAKTENIRVGSGGVMLPHYSSYKVAENFKVMSALAPGRVDLGIGRAPGGEQLATMALQGDRKRTVDIFPQQLDQVIEFMEDSLPFSHPLRGLQATPLVQEKPEVWLLGTSNFSAILAAQRGLPYAFAQFINNNPGDMNFAIRLYINNFKPSKNLMKPKTMVAMRVIVADTDEEAEYLAKSAIHSKYYLEKGRISRLIHPDQALGEVTYPYEKKDIEKLKNTFIIGSKDTVTRKLWDLTDQFQLDEFMAVSPIYDFEKRKRSFALLKEAVKWL
jgi:luciferase family oxidoreductase group 1